MNPPYGRSIGAGREAHTTPPVPVTPVVCLLPVRTDTVWWQAFRRAVWRGPGVHQGPNQVRWSAGQEHRSPRPWSGSFFVVRFVVR